MKAVGFYRYLPADHPESLLDLDVGKPVPTGHDLLVKVEAVSVNPLDTKMRAPRDKVETRPRVLGWDAAGTVVGTGFEASLFRAGDRVFYAGSITRPGANSEYHLVDERIAGPMPKTLDFAAAAALPLTAITAWEALFDRLGCSREGRDAGKAILIIGGAGGVGSIAIQLAKALSGAHVIATASREASRRWCMEMGAEHVIDHTGDICAQVKGLGLSGVERILCLNDTDAHFPAMASLVAPQGLICSIVENRAPIEIGALKEKSAGFVWESMFTRSRYGTSDMIEQHRLLKSVAECVEAGRVRTTLGQNLGTINAANLRHAHRLIEGSHTVGKLVLQGFK